MRSDAGLDSETIARLKNAAKAAMQNARAPYSGFPVGAAILCENGQIVGGCNVENASSGATVCAERTAIGTAVAQGLAEVNAVCVVGQTTGVLTPCGICRQTIIEFGRDIPVICCNRAGEHEVYSIAELLPHAFTADDL
ncbi:MAG: cytidine deaminase [Rhodobacteraceae bacterium]|nr:cytidine deaminase [Paracoccaceae bacterium]